MIPRRHLVCRFSALSRFHSSNASTNALSSSSSSSSSSLLSSSPNVISSSKTCHLGVSTNSNTAIIPPITQFYRRPLPETCIAFSSPEGRQIFREALAAGGMESYFPLAEQFCTQDEPAYCGLATLAMVLNALAVDPGRIWKGVWRWYSEALLDCCEALDLVKKNGISLPQFLCLAKCNGLAVESWYADHSSIEAFREVVEKVSGDNSAGKFLVCSYSRKLLGQTGDGHYSPIGGYHKEKDLVLVLDVARFKYAPHWVPVSVMFEAMKLKDPGTDRCRGFCVMQRSSLHSSILFSVSKVRMGQCSWQRAASRLHNVLARVAEQKLTNDQASLNANVSSNNGGSGNAVNPGDNEAFRTAARDFLKALICEMGVVLCDNVSCHTFAEKGKKCSNPPASEKAKLGAEHKMMIDILRQEIEATELYKIASEIWIPHDVDGDLLITQLCGLGPCHAVVVMGLAASSMLSSNGHGGVEQILKWMRDTDALPNFLSNEVRLIRLQLEELQGRRTLPK